MATTVVFQLTRLTSISFIGILILLLGVPPGVRATNGNPHTLRLSEIYPAPSGEAHEWVEVQNTGPDPVSLTGYSVRDASGKKLFLPEGPLLPGEYAIATASGVLNNGGDTVTLSDPQGLDLESVTYSGTFDAARSYAFCLSSGMWSITSSPSRAAANTSACPTPTPLSSPTALPTPTASPGTSAPSPTSAAAPTEGPAGDPGPLRISEILAAPEPGSREWVELYNPTDREITLSGWSLDDGPGAGSPVSLTGTIPSDGYRVIELPTAILNNGGDIARLFAAGTTTGTDSLSHDSLPYEAAERGISLGRAHTGAPVCAMSPSPGQPNLPCRDEPYRSTAGSTGSASGKTGSNVNALSRSMISVSPRPYQSVASSRSRSTSPTRKSTAAPARKSTSPTPNAGNSGRTITLETQRPPGLSNMLGWTSFALSLLAGGLAGVRMRDIPLWP